MKKIILCSLVSLSAFIFSHKAIATHMTGADISYQCNGSNYDFIVRLAFYRDCAGADAPGIGFQPLPTVNIRSASGGENFNIVLPLISFQEIIPYCTAVLPTECGGSTEPSREQYLYETTVTLPAIRTDWVMSWSLCCRNAAITTITSPDTRSLYVETKLNNSIFPCNSSPFFSNPPAPFIYVNQPYCYNNAAVDPDGDSLVYSLVTPMQSAATTVTYIVPFTATQPLTSVPPITLNTATGDVCMTPTVSGQVTVMALLVQEYRFGTLIGSTMRDIQINVIAGADLLPTTNGINGTGTYSDTIAEGCLYTFTTGTADANAAQCLTLTSNIAVTPMGLDGATFTVANGCPSLVRPTGTFNWTPSGGTASNTPYVFVTRLRDNACAVNGEEYKAWALTVIEFSAAFTSSAPACVNQPVNFYSQNYYSGYNYSWQFGSGAVATFSMSIDPNPQGVTYTTPGAKTVVLTITSPTGCSTSETMIITINPSPSASFTNTAPQCTGNAVNFTNTGTTGAGTTYFWDFGAGAAPATSSAENPAGIIYSTAGTKTVTHIVTNNFGCVTTTTVSITINQTPTASFSSTAPACTGSNVDFTNTGTSAGVTWFWNFGAGAVPATSVLQNPTGIVYSTAGTKSVTLTTTSATSTCTATAAQTININQTPAPAYTSTAPQCTGETVTFNYTGTTGFGWTYNWDFGTGATPATSSAQNPGSVVYSTAGTKTITITVTNNGLCAQTITGTITINQTPTASFSSTAPACTGANVDFTNTGTSAGVTWFWNFGAGAAPATSVLQNPTGIVYSTAGTKSVTLTTTSSTSTCTASAAQTININQTPAPAFTSTAPQCQGAAVTFNYTGTTGFGWTYNWDFGTGATPATSSAQNPGSVVYSTAGTKTITITVTNNGLCAQTVTGTITINQTPVASFTSTAPACTGDSVDFQNTGTTGATYAWDFGSGATPATSAVENPQDVIFSGAGVQTVTLVTTLGTCTDTSIQTINISQSPAPAFTSNAPQCANTAINFTYTGTTGIGWTYSWNFGLDANPGSSSAQNPSAVTYSTSGTKTITLTVSNSGCSRTITGTILINATPTASFTSTAPECTGMPVDFTNTGTVVGVIWSWNFGSGATPATSPVQDPVGIVYSTPGVKVVTLTTTNLTTGCAVTYTTTININLTPTVSFVTNAPQCQWSTVNFTNTGSTGLGWTYAWTFGSGAVPQTSTAENPTGIVYQTAGTKTVTLTISDANCSATTTQTITINPTPVASFTSNAPACTGDSVNFTNTGTLGVTYSWNFGSGATPATSAVQDPSGIIYSAPGIKTVVLIATIGSCSDTSSQTILINLTPSVSFTSNTPQCEGSAVNFTNTGSSGGNWVFNWSFGAGATPQTSNNENPNGITYATAGTKTVTLTISDMYCSASITQTITINAAPGANAGPDTVICANTSVQIGSAPVAGNTYSWFDPDGTLDSTTIANPVASPIAPTTIYIVTVTGTNGCTSTDSIVVTMLSPLIANAGTDGEICLYDSVQIGAGLIQGQTYLWVPNTGLTSDTLPNPVASPTVTTTYTLYVTGSGCGPETDEVTIIVHPLPLAEAGPDDTITIGSATQLTATGGIQYSWYPSYGLSNTGIYNPVANPTVTTTYYVIVTDVFGCSNIDSVTVFVIDASFWVPSAFTPNDDGANDVLYVRGSGITDLKFAIFNRWGEQVFYAELIEIGWDGNKQGTGMQMPEGAYAYFVRGTLTNGTAIDEKGLVNLIR